MISLRVFLAASLVAIGVLRFLAKQDDNEDFLLITGKDNVCNTASAMGIECNVNKSYVKLSGLDGLINTSNYHYEICQRLSEVWQRSR